MSSFILSIGSFHFVVPSATIATAIHEVLRDAIRLDPVAVQNGRMAWRSAVGDAPPIQVRPIVDGIGSIGSYHLASTPTAAAVLGEPRRSRMRTHKILIEAGRAS